MVYIPSVNIPLVHHLILILAPHTIKEGSEQYAYGGPRFSTFMLYLTSVEAGGYTVFPQAGIFVKPVAGTALFWFNSGPKSNYDSRMIHTGCPVLYGNKWIANKWVKWLTNFNKYPCHITQKHFKIN